MRFSFSNDAMKAIDKTDTKTAGRIVKGIMKLPSKGDIKALEGEYSGWFRLRVGDWRVIYTVENNTVMIVDISLRGDAYK